MNDYIELLFTAFDWKTLQVLFDTMIINFRSGVLIIWPFSRKVVISKISYFCDVNHTWLKEISCPLIHWLITNAKTLIRPIEDVDKDEYFFVYVFYGLCTTVRSSIWGAYLLQSSMIYVAKVGNFRNHNFSEKWP